MLLMMLQVVIKLLIVGLSQTFVELHSSDESIPFRSHIVHKFGIELNVWHNHPDDPHVINQL